jgi:hypothetical protein
MVSSLRGAKRQALRRVQGKGFRVQGKRNEKDVFTLYPGPCPLDPVFYFFV